MVPGRFFTSRVHFPFPIFVSLYLFLLEKKRKKKKSGAQNKNSTIATISSLTRVYLMFTIVLGVEFEVGERSCHQRYPDLGRFWYLYHLMVHWTPYGCRILHTRGSI